MDCTSAHELISAAADDELSADERHALEGHLDACADCIAQAARVAALTRALRIRPAVAGPDLVDRVLDRARPPRLGRGGWLQPALAWVAVVIAAQSIRPLVLGDASGATTHTARHLGAFALALSIGMLYAAWRPHRAFGMLPFAAALVATMAVSAVLDVTSSTQTPFDELVHVSELAGLVLLWMVAGSPGWDRLRRLRSAPAHR